MTFDDVYSSVYRRADSVHEALEAIADITGRATSEDSSVTAAVDAHGTLVDLEFSESLRSHRARAVAASVLAAAAAAAEDASIRRDRTLESLWSSLTDG